MSNPSNLLKQLDNAKTGDGIRRDVDLDIRNAFLNSDGSALTTTLATNPGFAVAETNAVVLQWAATKVVGAGYAFNVPGDYDQTKDELKLRVIVQSAGATDTPGLTANVYRKRAGAALSADLGPITFKNVGETASFAASATSAVAVAIVSAKSLQPGDQLIFKIVPGAHGTDALNVYGLTVRYRGDVALFTESER